MPTLYALLVGINNYPVKPLGGCINDVNAVDAYLRDHCRRTGMHLHIRRLTDVDEQQPTRNNMIDAFGFFEPAAPGDYCLFYYSGHGSYSPAPPEFWTETDGAVESFVCIDSRTPGGRDLMDKEMGFLLWKTFRKKPDVQVVVITDCCHSGTLSRAGLDSADVTDRMMTGVNMPAAASGYLGFDELIDGERCYVPQDEGKRITVRQTGHIHLCASRDNQTAKELIIDGERRGAFTHSLLKILYATGGQVSYRDLVRKAAVSVRNMVSDQHPDYSVNGGLERSTANRIFLAPEGAGQQPEFLVFHDPKTGWCIQAGAVHGVSAGDKVIIEGVCTTMVTHGLGADRSAIVGKPELNAPANTYQATVIRQPNQALAVAFAPDVPETVRQLLQQAITDHPSDFLHLATESAGHIIRQHGSSLYLTKPASTKPLFEPVEVHTAEQAAAFLEKAVRVSRWLHLQELTNASSRLNAQHFSLQLYRNTAQDISLSNSFVPVPEDEEPADFYYMHERGGEWQQPAFRLQFTNKGSTDLWFGCAYLGFDYSINTDFFAPVQVAPGQTTWLHFVDQGLTSDIIPLVLEERYQQLGYQTITEHLKVFVGTEPVDLSGLTQEGLDLPAVQARNAETFSVRGVGAARNHTQRSDWTTETIGLRINKPMEATPLLSTKPIALQGIIIEPHALLSGSVALGSTAGITNKSIEGVLPPNRACSKSGLAPFDLSAGTRSAAPLDVLELLEVHDPSVVSADAPLVVRLTATRAVDEALVLPLAYDNESGLYYPVGYMDEKGDVVIDVLPDVTSSDPAITAKSLGGSIKIYFQKVLGKWTGKQNDYPRLAVAKTKMDGNVEYEADKEIVAKAVAGAQNILLFIHGIIGDTKGMVACTTTPLEHGSTLEKGYNLVLAFDYENLNTGIHETAQKLKERLAAAGLIPNHGKKLTIVAHSMGGLVSRWFIEKLGGKEVVQQLVMFGTPNRGSHWADVRDLAETMLTYALNGAAFLKPWMFALAGLGKLVKGTQITLRQMDAETGIYTTPTGEDRYLLNDGTDPGIPYTIVAGNTQQIIVNYEKTSSLIQRVLKRIRGRGVYDALDKVLFKEPNDIAVTVNSIGTIPGSESWRRIPVVHPAASDHLSYFTYSQLLMLIQFNELYQDTPKPTITTQ